MTTTVGGSSGVVFPDTTNLPAGQVTTYLTPGMTDTANVMTIQPNTQVNGTTGLRVNNTTVSSASTFYPANTVLPVVTGTTRDTQVLTCSTGTWTNTPTSYAYQWVRGTSTNVGTNASTYTCVTADIGSTIKCTVTATNAVGTGTGATSATVGPITANTYTATYLAVAGGGGGGGGWNGGGGAGGGGGFLNTTTTFTPGVVYTATVGGGGASVTQGANSTITGSGFSTITATGGGYGGDTYAGGNGGSGGGGGTNASTGLGGGTGSQGGNGGAGATIGTDWWDGGGGGGAGGSGSGGYNNGGGNGGSGSATSITGSSVTYSGGGGGASGNGTQGTGGAGGGGNGRAYGSTNKH